MESTQQEKSGSVSVDVVQVQGPDALASEEVLASALTATRERPPVGSVVDASHLPSLPVKVSLQSAVMDAAMTHGAEEFEIRFLVVASL